LPTGGRVTASSLDLVSELWRHERPLLPTFGGTPEAPLFKNLGDVVASGIAIGNGVAYFTTPTSGKLIAVDTANGKMLKEISIGPIFTGPALSRGRIYVGSGNTLFSLADFFFPKKPTGVLFSFGLPGDDEIDKLSKTNP